MANVTFKEGTSSAYYQASLSSYTFYHTTDDDLLHLGYLLLGTHIKAALWASYAQSSTSYVDIFNTPYTSLTSTQQKELSHIVGFVSGSSTAVVSYWSIGRSSSSMLSVYVTIYNLDVTSSAPGTVPVYIVYYDI